MSELKLEKIKMPNTVARQIMLNKFLVNTLPIANEGLEEQTIKEALNAKIVLSSSPFAYDFICNMLAYYKLGHKDIKRLDTPNTENNIYHFTIKKDLAIEYFKDEKRLNNFMRNQDYYNEYKYSFIQLWRQKERKYYLQPMKPYNIFSLPTNHFSMDLLLPKCVFSGLIEPYENNLKITGYITLPSEFFPTILDHEATPKKANIMYKTNIKGLLINPMKKEMVSLPRQELIEAISPDSIVKETSYLRPGAFQLLHETISPTIEKIVDIYGGEFFLVRKFFLGTTENKRKGRKEVFAKLFFVGSTLQNTKFKQDLPSPQSKAIEAKNKNFGGMFKDTETTEPSND